MGAVGVNVLTKLLLDLVIKEGTEFIIDKIEDMMNKNEMAVNIVLNSKYDSGKPVILH